MRRSAFGYWDGTSGHATSPKTLAMNEVGNSNRGSSITAAGYQFTETGSECAELCHHITEISVSGVSPIQTPRYEDVLAGRGLGSRSPSAHPERKDRGHSQVE